jgi:sugar lactone lactonase YvrE
MVTVASAWQAGEGQLEKLSAGHDYASAVAWSRDGFLLIGDGPAGQVSKIDSKGKTVYRDGIAAVGLAFDEEGRLYLCDSRSRHVIRIDRKNKTDVIASGWEGKRLNGPADVVVLKKDHVYFTDPAFATADTTKELPHYGIYHVGPKGEIAAIATLPVRPNGIALSPDGRTLYASIADARTILAWTLDKNGVASAQRVLVSGIEGVPAGIDVAPDGRLFVAARELLVYSPDGKLLGNQPVPEKPVDVALGEADFNTAFIAAGGSVYRYRLPVELHNKTGARY